jgi:hypothetical protein
MTVPAPGSAEWIGEELPQRVDLDADGDRPTWAVGPHAGEAVPLGASWVVQSANAAFGTAAEPAPFGLRKVRCELCESESFAIVSKQRLAPDPAERVTAVEIGRSASEWRAAPPRALELECPTCSTDGADPTHWRPVGGSPGFRDGFDRPLRDLDAYHSASSGRDAERGNEAETSPSNDAKQARLEGFGSRETTDRGQP